MPCANGHVDELNHIGRCRACASDRQKRYWLQLDPSERKKRKNRQHARYKLKHGDKEAERKKEWNLKNRYGISLSEYRRVFSCQGERCKICKTSDPGDKRHWHLDHDHKTGKVRSILCARCNVMIAMAREDEGILVAAIQYLSNCRDKGMGISSQYAAD